MTALRAPSLMAPPEIRAEIALLLARGAVRAQLSEVRLDHRGTAEPSSAKRAGMVKSRRTRRPGWRGSSR